MFRKVLVANRGEIAIRIMRACDELNVSTVAIYSDADKHSAHVDYANEAYNVGPARPADSYLDQSTIIDVAQKADVDAIHPGYGFLAENATFARRVEETDGITWIGPSSNAMEQLGEKTKARSVMDAADVPIVPGTTEPIEDIEDIKEFGDEHGYPIAIKAEGGGGGRGMKVVTEAAEIKDQLESARREGEAYFDNDSVYLERYLESPRHIEVQILADQHDTILHLGERDCSLQRRHQKVLEEAPSPELTPSMREEIGEAAKRGAERAGYENAGTVEFLLEDGNFYFLEVNTRIQVEHCVTEEITGIDIVKWQIRIAAGEALDIEQSDVTFSGHAMEFRINAENAAKNFQPVNSGHLDTYTPAGGIGVRVDDALRQGDDIVTDYDSMIAKLIVHGGDRNECILRSLRALREYDIEGVTTLIPFHRLILSDKTFVESNHTTKYLDEQIDTTRIADAQNQWGYSSEESAEDTPSIEREYTVEVNGKRFKVNLEERGELANRGQAQSSQTTGRPSTSRKKSSTPSTQSQGEGDGEEVTTEMQGTIVSVSVSEGDEVESGDVLVVLEAMKMENDIVASRGGTVTHINVEAGDSVDMGDTLVILE